MTRRARRLIWACVAGLVLAVTVGVTVGALRHGDSGTIDCSEIGVEEQSCPGNRAMG